MRPDEVLVGSLALVFSLIAFSIGLGPWLAPYRLRTFHWIDERYGKAAARTVWIIISLALLASGLAILAGTRPRYALPKSEGASVERPSIQPDVRAIAIGS